MFLSLSGVGVLFSLSSLVGPCTSSGLETLSFVTKLHNVKGKTDNISSSLYVQCFAGLLLLGVCEYPN